MPVKFRHPSETRFDFPLSPALKRRAIVKHRFVVKSLNIGSNHIGKNLVLTHTHRGF
jgi:hypothetical protein